MQVKCSKNLDIWFDGTNYFGARNKFERKLLHKIDFIKLKIYFKIKLSIIDKIWVYVGNWYANKDMRGK